MSDPPRASFRVLAARIWLLLRLARTAAPVSVAVMAVLTVVAGLAPITNMWLQRAVLNGLVPRRTGGLTGTASHPVSGGHLLEVVVIMGGVGLVTAVIPYARVYTQAELRRGMGLLIQDTLFRAINSFPGLSRFESPVFFDRIRIAQQIGTNISNQLISATLICGQSLITAAGMFVTLDVINPVLTVIVAATAVPAIAAQIANSRRHADLEWQKSPAMRRQMFYSRLLSDRDAAKEVRLFGLGDFLRGRMLAELRAINRGQRGLDRQILSTEGGLALLAAIITGGGLLWTVRQALSGRLSVGDVSLFVMAVIGVQNSLSSLISRLADVYETLLLSGHYVDVVAAGPDLPVATPPRELPALREGIEVRDVWFRYDPDHPWVLRGLTMFIPRGQPVALIGLNGAGKSTLVKLLCRLYDPQRGTIRWDGIDIKDVAPDDLRRRIGTVFQDYMAYDLTAAENIGLGDLDGLGDRDRIRGAAEQAGVHGTLTALPHGYDTLLSRAFFSNEDKENPDTGVILSGGQWQRVALARGLMRADRDLLILDEPSSGLDAAAEHAIHRRLCEIRAGCTSLLISHRLGSVRDASVIYVLSGGRVVERGTHDELMLTRGEYHKLFTLQASGYRG